MKKKSHVFNIATAWSLPSIVNHYLYMSEIKDGKHIFKKKCPLQGGYINAKYRKVKITVVAEEIP